MRRWTVMLVVAMLAAGCAAPPSPAPAPAPAPPVVQEPVPAPPPTPPPPRVILESDQVLQGDFATLRLEGHAPGAVRLTVKGLDEQPRLFDWYGSKVAFIGFPAAARVGSYPVTVTWEGGEWTGNVEVVRKKFTEDRLVVTEEQESVYFDPNGPAEWEKVYKLRESSNPEPLWRGAFQVPLKGPLTITTYFGEIRFVNGVETGRHSGMDFGVPTGTPIFAPARGKVIYAQKMIVTGNTVIIDHGYNLFTAYYHCETLQVEPGDQVWPGDRIATVGSTGFSTGPHLHWTATIGNTPVDPWPLTTSPPLGLYGPPEVRPERPRE